MSAATLLAPLRGEYGLTNALALALVGASCGAAGVWVVHFGRAFLAESLTHALLPGLVAAALLGASLLVGALAGVLAAYVAVLALQRAPKTSPAAATSIAVGLLVACGALLASARGGAPLTDLLFGDPLAASAREAATAGALAAAIFGALWLLHTRFAALAFDAGAAGALGLRAAGVRAAVLAMIVLAVAVAANIAGSLLALALVTGPALGVIQARMRLGRSLVAAALAGAACGLGGILASYALDWPASASIALLAGVCAFAPVAAAGLARGLGTTLGRIAQPDTSR